MTLTAIRNPGDRAALMSKHGITIKSEFVPFSKSRNAKEKDKTLNWRVTLQKDGRDILTTDYSAGIAHCPAYKASVAALGGRESVMRHEAIALECESGFYAPAWQPGPRSPRTPIKVGSEDVLYSLLLDAAVLDESSYEDWAANMGYDPDSRKGEAVYRSCLETALKLRNGLGEAVLAELREAFQDY